jgi:NAD-specific glutamate dehydrogenase
LRNRGLLNRKVETLPRRPAAGRALSRGKPLTRAEIGVLLSYAKIVLFDEVVASDLPDDPYFAATLSAISRRQDARRPMPTTSAPPAAPRDHRDRPGQ